VVAWVLLAAVATVGCEGEEDGNGPTMLPGEDCLACHNPGGSAREEWFGAAGTVFDPDGNPAAGVTVAVTDSLARAVSDVTNSAGNFYFPQELTPPLQVTISAAAGAVSMADATGACNSCHRAGGSPGPIIYQ
jgi:hypothetical protein